MATSGNDKITVTNGVNAGAAGDDTYILSPASFASATNAKIKISDTQGSNTIQLNGGLQIVKSVVASHTTKLTLNNGAEVTVLGADTFNYITADTAGVAIGTSQKYGNFATTVLNTTVPAASAAGVMPVLKTQENVAVVIKTDGTGVTEIPLVKLTASAASVNEGGAVTYTATLSSAAPVGGLNVPYTISGSANAADYTTTSTGTITIAAGATTGTLVLNTTADTQTEGAEAVTVTLGQGTIPSTTAIVASTAVSTTINDTSLVPVAVTLTANATAVNEGAAVTYMATAASAAPVGGWSIPYTLGGTATTPADYTTTSTGTITIAAGQTVGTLALNAVADSLTEGAEAVTVALSNTVAGLAISTTALSTTINDASLTPAGTPTVTLTASPTSVNEGSAVTYTATLTGGTSTTALSIPYTLGGTATATADYTTSASTITIAAGATTGTLVLSAVADTLTETAPEVVTVALNTVTGVAINSAPVSTTINDTSLTPVVTPVVVLPTVTLSSNAAAAGINEGAAVIYTATLTSAAPANGLSIPYTLSGTGIALGDFTPALTALTGNITIAAGATTGSVTLTTANDLSTSEGAETLAITLGVATGVTLGTTTTVSTLIADTSTATVNGLISQAVSAAGSVDANTLPGSNVQFDFIAGKYAYTIANFGKGDVLNFPGDINPTINNILGTDGNIDVQWADGGSLVVVTLTGLTTAQDTPIYSLGSFNSSTTGFGPGSII